MTSSPFRGQLWLAGDSPLLSSLRPLLGRQVRVSNDQIHEQSSANPAQARPGDLIIDLTPPRDPVDLLQACHDRGVLYLSAPRSPGVGGCYDIYTNIRDRMRRWPEPWGATALLEHGAAPGLVSHLVKRALADLVRSRLAGRLDPRRRLGMEASLVEEHFAHLAFLAGVCSIHAVAACHEANHREAANRTTEVGWGTHESTRPPGSGLPNGGPRNQLTLPATNGSTDVRSWNPAGPLLIQAIGRADAFTVSDHLTLWESGQAIYRPTVVAAQSRHVDGLSVLLLDRSGPVWWCGWPTKICEAASLASAASWVVRHPRSGVRVPDDLPHDALLDQVRPWLGEPQSQPLAPISCDFRMQDSQFMSLLA